MIGGLVRRVIRKIRGRKVVPPPKIDERLEGICKQIRDEKLTFLSQTMIHSLVSIVEQVERDQVSGKIIEAGCALGGSAIAMCAAKTSKRELELYDTFEMIPPPTEKDGEDVHERYRIISSGEAQGIDGGEYYGYLKDIPERVTKSFEKFGCPIEQNAVTLHKGLLQDTMSVESPVAVAHVDVDWYDPVYTCLERIVPHLSVGGAIILDDYFAWSGCRKATDDFFRGRRNEFDFDSQFRHLIVRKKAN